MSDRKNSLRVLLLGVLFGFAITACGGEDDIFTPDGAPDITAAALFEEANNAMRKEDYVTSVKLFTRLKEDYPFSSYIIEAELSLADSYYRDGEWLSAVEAYKEFESMHPRHEAMPYVLYQIGMGNLQTYTSVDHPPTLVLEAQSYFTRLRDSFPGHEYALRAVLQIKTCRQILAEYEVYTGDFYFRTGNYYAAWLRYVKVVGEYPEIRNLWSYADNRRHLAYFLHMKDSTEARRRLREDTWHNWFDWL
ncbi:MAG: outer membrane protein assembly factor BamD [Deltaproteobacteria bacterium]|jgi:outer membrane protein assembly factor BamD|nr:outer membrane protein assembly factor BamD [Deltaproteobacteria bacterium]